MPKTFCVVGHDARQQAAARVLRRAGCGVTAADNAAEFVSLAIQQTPADQDTRYGVWFEPLLPRLCPVSWND